MMNLTDKVLKKYLGNTGLSESKKITKVTKYNPERLYKAEAALLVYNNYIKTELKLSKAYYEAGVLGNFKTNTEKIWNWIKKMLQKLWVVIKETFKKVFGIKAKAEKTEKAIKKAIENLEKKVEPIYNNDPKPNTKDKSNPDDDLIKENLNRRNINNKYLENNKDKIDSDMFDLFTYDETDSTVDTTIIEITRDYTGSFSYNRSFNVDINDKDYKSIYNKSKGEYDTINDASNKILQIYDVVNEIGKKDDSYIKQKNGMDDSKELVTEVMSMLRKLDIKIAPHWKTIVDGFVQLVFEYSKSSKSNGLDNTLASMRYFMASPYTRLVDHANKHLDRAKKLSSNGPSERVTINRPTLILYLYHILKYASFFKCMTYIIVGTLNVSEFSLNEAKSLVNDTIDTKKLDVYKRGILGFTETVSHLREITVPTINQILIIYAKIVASIKPANI